MSIRSGSGRVPVAPLLALFALAVSAIVGVASSSVCTRPMAMPAMAGMPGGDNGWLVCPLVLALLAVSSVLAAWALVTFGRDPHRAATGVALVRALARLPVVPAFVALAGAGTLATVAIVAADGGAVPAPSTCMLLAFVIATLALVFAGAAVLVARLVRALWQRLDVLFETVAIVRAAPAFTGVAAVPRVRRSAPPLALRSGLRAPPLGTH